MRAVVLSLGALLCCCEQAPQHRITSVLALADGGALVRSRDDLGDQTMLARIAATGASSWSITFAGAARRIAVRDGIVTVRLVRDVESTPSVILAAFDLDDGRERWETVLARVEPNYYEVDDYPLTVPGPGPLRELVERDRVRELLTIDPRTGGVMNRRLLEHPRFAATVDDRVVVVDEHDVIALNGRATEARANLGGPCRDHERLYWFRSDCAECPLAFVSAPVADLDQQTCLPFTYDGSWPMKGCSIYAGEPVLEETAVFGLDTRLRFVGGAPRTLELGGETNPRQRVPAPLPRFVPYVLHADDLGHEVLVLADLERRTVAWRLPLRWRATVIQHGRDWCISADGVLVSIDGASGRLRAAIDIGDLAVTPENIAGDSLWLAGGRLLARLDAATLQPTLLWNLPFVDLRDTAPWSDLHAD